MSTTLPPADRTFARRWTAFWFAPGDPTTLGFMRVVTGLLIVYIHLAYSLDLQAFFGKFGWYGAAYMERERHQFPYSAGSLTNWVDEDPQPRVPEFPHRRQAVMRFVRGLPERQAERARALQFLDRVSREGTNQAWAALDFVQATSAAGPAQEVKITTALEEGRQLYGVAQNGEFFYLDTPPKVQEQRPLIPEFLRALPEADRKAAATDLRALLPVLPKNPSDVTYVLAHLKELDQPYRRALVEFLATLPDDAAERDRLVTYLEYWNGDPRKLYRQGHALVSVWFHVSDPTQMAVIHGFALFIMLLFTVGFCTRVTGVLTWLAVIGYVHRGNQVLFGMDTMMNILLTYLVIGNSGAALSVDRLIARYRAARASLRRSGTIDEPTRAFLARPPLSGGATFGVRLIQVHFCFIYLAAGLSKLQGGAWWSGNAFWDVMVNPEFTLMKYHWFEDMVRATASFKPLYYFTIATGVWFTWGLEVTFPFLVWTRVRPFMLWLAVLLHAGIGVLMGLNLFELLMMTMLLVFFPAGVIRDRLRGGSGLPKLGFAFDPADPKQARAAALVLAADVDGQVTPEPGRGKNLPVLTAGAGPVSGAAGVAALFDTVRLLRFARYLLLVPGVAGLIARRLFPSAGTPPTAGTGTGTTGSPRTPAAAS